MMMGQRNVKHVVSKALFLYFFLIVIGFGGVIRALEPTKLIDSHVYTLISQHDGRFLSDGGNGIPTKVQEGNKNLNQQFKFINVPEGGGDVWMLVGLSSSKPLAGTSWRITYVGHGKYQLQNTKTRLCQQGGTVEGVCGKLIPIQRWFVEQKPN